jgi:hypothetical protein
MRVSRTRRRSQSRRISPTIRTFRSSSAISSSRAHNFAGETAFGFVHIDVDVYPPTAFCLDFFSTRLAPGAWMVVDDYGVITCPGAQKAVDDFVRNNPSFSKVHLLSGQAIVFRAG